MQAMLSVTVVDGVPLPAGEEFTGVIRTQDVRATEKDKVKISDCFRGGDVVKGIVVGTLHCARSTHTHANLRFLWGTREATTLQLLAMILE